MCVKKKKRAGNLQFYENEMLNFKMSGALFIGVCEAYKVPILILMLILLLMLMLMLNLKMPGTLSIGVCEEA